MWGVDPNKLCNQHLLGEHVEMHMFAGTIKNDISIQGYVEKGLVNPRLITERHTVLAKEMVKRGMNHKSPLEFNSGQLPENMIAIKKNERELRKRCKNCLV